MKLLFAMGLLFIISFRRKTNVNCEHNENNLLTYGFKVRPSDYGSIDEIENNVGGGFELPKEKHKNETSDEYEEDYENTETNKDTTSDNSSKNSMIKPKIKKIVKFPEDFENEISNLEIPIKTPSMYIEDTINNIINAEEGPEEEKEEYEEEEEEEKGGEINIEINETSENKKPSSTNNEEQGQVTKIKINKIKENKVKKTKPVIFDINPKRNNTHAVGLGSPNNQFKPTTPTLIHKETILSNLNPIIQSERVIRPAIRPSRDVSLILRKGYYRPIVIRSRRLPWPVAPAPNHKFVNHRHYHYPHKAGKKKRKCKPCKKHGKRKPKKNMQRNILYREKLTAHDASCNENSVHPTYSNHYYQHPQEPNYYPDPTYAPHYSQFSSYPSTSDSVYHTSPSYNQFQYPKSNPITASNYPSTTHVFPFPKSKDIHYPTKTESTELHDGYSVQEQEELDHNAYDQKLDNIDAVPVVEEDEEVVEGERDVDDDEAEESNIDEDDNAFDGKFGYKINITSKSDVPIKRTATEEPFKF